MIIIVSPNICYTTEYFFVQDSANAWLSQTVNVYRSGPTEWLKERSWLDSVWIIRLLDDIL